MKARRRATWAAVAVLAMVVVAGLVFVSQAPAVSTPVVISSGRPEAPSISGTLVAWADKRSGNWDVYTHDGASGRTTRVTSDGADQAMPSLGGGMLAYVDFSTNQGDIVLKDLATSAVSRLEIVGPQMNPVVTDGWLTYEDRSNPYSLVVIRALDGSYYNEFGASNYSASRPMVAGNLLVYENRDASGSAGDADIKALDLVTKTEFLIASSPAQELFPTTDGRYIAWAQGTESGSFKIRLYDRQTGIYTDLSGDVGEQTRPFISDGVVYWIDNVTGQPLHVDTYEIATGKTSPYYTYSTGDVIALAASGHNTAWLENVGNRSRVRAVFSDGTGPLAGLAAFKPLIASGTFRPLSVVAGADGIAPTVISTSVEPGQRNVSKTAALTVSFSEELSAKTVDSSSFKLVEAGTGDIVASSVSYSALTKTVKVTPVDPLGNGAYTLIVEPTVADTAGNRLGTPTEVSFGTLGAAADIYPPSTPWIQYARPSGLSNVEIAWDPATDDGGPIKEYRVYRSLTPILFADLIPGNLVAVVNGSTTSVTTATAATDSLKSYTYYYAVAAVDSADRLSDPPSTSAAPNPHGTFGTSSRRGVRSCTRCHDVHGGMAGTPDLQANSAEQCYACHGATPGNNLYGYASTMDSQGQFNDDNGITTGGTEGIGNDNWRVHRTSYLYAGSGATVNYQCMACHTAHRKAYDDDPAKSFGRLLRMYPNGLTGASRYSTDTAPFNESLCYQCHGATSLTLMQALSPGAYSNTGGDHQTGYTDADAAHRAAVVMKNRPPRTRANGGTLPNIACTACHNEHASPNQGMTDYRQSNTTQTTFNQAGLCFECHTKGTGSDGQNEVISSGTVSTGFTWNGRDVKAEFQRTSRHPMTVGGGTWVPRTGTVFFQTLQADFQSDALTQTVATVLDSVVLGQYSTDINPPLESYLFAHDGGTQVMDQYRPADNAWNANNYGKFDPPNNGSITTGAGSQLFSAGGKVYVTRPGTAGSPSLVAYTPPADVGNGTWAPVNITMNSATGNGAASAVNTAASVVYLSAGNSDNNINWFRYSDNTEDNLNFSANIGAGSAIAYAPTADRLFVINRNGGASDGRIYWTDNPGTPAGTTPAWTTGGTARQLTSNGGTTYYNRLAHFRDGAGVEYLMMIGADTGGANDTVIVSALGAATVNTTFLNISPFGAALAEGCDLKWDGVNGGYLYAIRGGTNSTMARIRIPAANAQTATNWTTGWTSLAATPWSQGAGSGIAFCSANPPSYAGGSAYYSSGTVMTPDITMPGRPTSWGTLTWSEFVPASTGVSVKVQGWNGGSWVDLVTSATSPVNLAGYSPATYPKLRLVATLTTSDTAATPRLDQWSVTANWDEWLSGEFIPESRGVFSQTLQAEFSTDVLDRVLANAADSVELDQYVTAIDPPLESYLFGHDGGTQVMDQYRPADNAWNANNFGKFDPPDNGSFATGTGSQLFSAGGKVYVTRPAQTSPQITAYTPPADAGNGTWAPIAITFNSVFGAGAASAVNTASTAVYLSAGNNDNNINWFRYDNNTENNLNFSASIGAGSAIAYAPSAVAGGRLFVINRNGGASDGRIYWTDNPGTPAGTTPAWTTGGTARQLTSNGGTTYYNRLAHFRDGAGVEYLMMIGADTGGANDTVIVSNLGAATLNAPTFLDKAPFTGGITDGCDLKWDGVNGGYMYAIRGGTNSTMARIQIPANDAQTAANWGTWQSISGTPWTQGAGAGIAFADADPPGYNGVAYYDYGDITTQDDAINAPGDAVTWGNVVWSESEPANTGVSVTVQGWNGASWTDLVTSATSPVDLSGFSTSTYPSVRLLGVLSTDDPAATPLLNNWSVTAIVNVFNPSGAVTCANCHNAHEIKVAGASAWQLGRVSDPSNTHNAASGDFTTFCMKCHGATPPTVAKRTSSEIVPYAVSLRTVDASQTPFLTGYDKSTAGGFVGSAHDVGNTANGGQANCDTCHDPHGSNNERLLAWTRPTSGVTWQFTPQAGTRDNTSTAAVEENLCYKCHGDSATGGRGRVTGVPNVYSPMASTYAHNTNAVSGRHSDMEAALDLGATNRHAECVDCHDPHTARKGIHTAGSSAAGPALAGAIGVKPTYSSTNWSVATGFAPQRIVSGGTDPEAYVCLKCHSSYSGQPFTVTTGSGTYTSTDVAQEFNPANQSGHNVLGAATWPKTSFVVNGTTYTWSLPTESNILKAGWTYSSKVTCSDCHTNSAGQARGPHGSTMRYAIDSAYTNPWDTAYLGTNETTLICAKCHVTSFRSNNYNSVHGDSNHSGSTDARCTGCHIRIPHGWKRPRLLGYRSDPAPYNSYYMTGIVLQSYTPGGWNKSDCGQSGCGEHSGSVSPLWP